MYDTIDAPSNRLRFARARHACYSELGLYTWRGRMAETLEDIGELGLIGRIAEKVFTSPDMALGFQDDAALWRQGEGWIIATTDALVEDVDFRLRTFSWEDIGWKALAVNLSDIAAMGGVPRGALVTLCLPTGCKTADVSAFYRGMSLLAEEAETPIVGGDLSSSAQVTINVAVIGEVESRERTLRRSTAQVGDQVAVRESWEARQRGWCSLSKAKAAVRIMGHGSNLRSGGRSRGCAKAGRLSKPECGVAWILVTVWQQTCRSSVQIAG